MFLQTLVKVLTKLYTKKRDHLVLVHLGQGRPIHGTICQTEGTRIKLGVLYMVADPVQNILCCPAMRADLSVWLSCREKEAEMTSYTSLCLCNNPFLHFLDKSTQSYNSSEQSCREGTFSYKIDLLFLSKHINNVSPYFSNSRFLLHVCLLSYLSFALIPVCIITKSGCVRQTKGDLFQLWGGRILLFDCYTKLIIAAWLMIELTVSKWGQSKVHWDNSAPAWSLKIKYHVYCEIRPQLKVPWNCNG